MKTLSEMLVTVARQNSTQAAVVEGETIVTYAELEKQIRSLSGQLYQRGVRQGDRVAVFLPNGLDFIRSYFAIVGLGTIVVPLNDQYQQTELLYFLRESRVSMVITTQLSAAACRQVLQSYESPCQLFFIENRDKTPESRLGGDFTGGIDPDTAVMYQFSSGSTGRPKRIARTHRNLLFELNSLVRTLGLTHEDRFLGVTPFSHVNGLMRSMMASLRAGATLYAVPKFERQAVAQMIQEHRISVFIGVPFMFGVMAKTNYGRRPDFSSLRLCISASAPMPPKLNRQFYEKFGIHVRQLYGSTETGTISVNLNPDLETSLESVGTPIDSVEIDVFREDGRSAEVAELGEVAVKSPAAIQGYDGLNEDNQSCFRDGFFLTGDLGWRDARGLLYLSGRKKLLINKAGYKINPREIEDLLENHVKVEEAVVFGFPTPYGDEKVKAVIVLKERCTEEEIIEHCRDKIASYKIPSLIEFADNLPKSATGKVRRAALI